MRDALLKFLKEEVRRIQIVANRQVNDILAGEYLTAFKGRGMEFDSVREYVPGDEIRNIDWNVTARSSVPHVKKFQEERELTILLLIDISASGAFGTVKKSKLDTAVEVAAVLMFSALKNHDKVGMALFADDVLRYIPPRKGRSNVLRLIRDLLSVEPVKKPTEIGKEKRSEFVGHCAAPQMCLFPDERFHWPGLFARAGRGEQTARHHRDHAERSARVGDAGRWIRGVAGRGDRRSCRSGYAASARPGIVRKERGDARRKPGGDAAALVGGPAGHSDGSAVRDELAAVFQDAGTAAAVRIDPQTLSLMKYGHSAFVQY